MTLNVSLYGRLKDAGLGDVVKLTLAPKATASEALSSLAVAFGPNAALLKGCVLATEAEVLGENDILTKASRLACLPPVCGG